MRESQSKGLGWGFLHVSSGVQTRVLVRFKHELATPNGLWILPDSPSSELRCKICCFNHRVCFKCDFNRDAPSSSSTLHCNRCNCNFPSSFWFCSQQKKPKNQRNWCVLTGELNKSFHVSFPAAELDGNWISSVDLPQIRYKSSSSHLKYASPCWDRHNWPLFVHTNQKWPPGQRPRLHTTLPNDRGDAF